MNHSRSYVAHGLRAGQVVRIREQIAFKTLRLGIEVANQGGLAARDLEKFLAPAESRLLHSRGDVKDVEALRDHESAHVDIAARNSIVNFAQPGGMVKGVFTGLERCTPMQIVPGQERVAAADDPGILQIAGDVPGRTP